MLECIGMNARGQTILEKYDYAVVCIILKSIKTDNQATVFMLSGIKTHTHGVTLLGST